jgi:hypothetical protein
MTDERNTATGAVWLDRLTYPYWWLLEVWSTLRLDRVLGISGPWWTRRAQRRVFWDGYIRQSGGW